MKIYAKPPLTTEKLIEHLQSRELKFTNVADALRHLANIDYYRMRAYMQPFRETEQDENRVTHFKEGSTWEKIYALYIFDRKLRLLTFDAIGMLEIAVRAQIVHQLCLKYGSHWQDQRDIFKIQNKKTDITFDIYEEIQRHIKNKLNNNQTEMFLQHYKDKYDSPQNPPCWIDVETMYFSHLSHICKNLKNRADLAGISYYFDLPPYEFCSWLHAMSFVRNICAHHARLWDRKMNITPAKLEFSKNLKWLAKNDSLDPKKFYYSACILNYFLQTIDPESLFKTKLINLIDEYKDVVSLSSMGFPQNWKDESMWKI